MKPHTGKTLLLVCAFLCSQYSKAQTNIGGTINTYVDVTMIGPCANKIQVSSSSGFTAGNSVILIQMQGATMDETTASSFGDILDYNQSGFWEKAIIHSVYGTEITFKKNLLNSYSVGGKVQMISLPTFTSANVTSNLTGSAWNGITGGVIALEVSGSLNLNSDIVASAIGFRGGTDIQYCPNSCGGSNNAYYYGAPNYRGAYKGEGIKALISGKELGRGKQTNGGGGANDHNNGGAGGGNYSAGGLGGNNNLTSGCWGWNNYGRSGLALDYTDKLHLFLGGGGGAGHGNNGPNGTCGGTAWSGIGGNGGGIVIILANEIIGNGNSIIAKGGAGGSGSNDGAAGGGAGGVIFLNVPTFSGSLNLNVSGGDGGDTYNDGVNRCYGPGGGGGAGNILSMITLPVNVITSLSGGLAGYVRNSSNACNNTHTTATDGGTTSSIITGVTVPQSISGPSAGCGLPVTFIHFTGKAVKENIELKWATATEVDADYFAIERSSNQVDFIEIGRVSAVGNTSTRTDYGFVDGLPYPGTNYYRIRQADVTGYEKLTNVIAVNPEINRLVKNIYPNPVMKGRELFVSFTDPQKDHEILLTDISGRLIRQWHRRRQPNNPGIFNLPLSHAGIYMLIVQTNERSEVIKLVVE